MKMVKVIIGNIETIDDFEEELRIGVGKVRSETKNEVEYCFIGKIYYLSYDEDLKEKVDAVREKDLSYWLPKSQIEVRRDEGYILLPTSLVLEKDLNEHVVIGGKFLKDTNECVDRWKKIIGI